MRRPTLLSTPIAFAVALLGTAAPALAEQFALFVYETPADFAARNDPSKAQAYWGGFAALQAAYSVAIAAYGPNALSASEAARLLAQLADKVGDERSAELWRSRIR